MINLYDDKSMILITVLVFLIFVANRSWPFAGVVLAASLIIDLFFRQIGARHVCKEDDCCSDE